MPRNRAASLVERSSMWQSTTGNRRVSDSEDTIRLTSSPNESASRRSLTTSCSASAEGDWSTPASSSAPKRRCSLLDARARFLAIFRSQGGKELSVLRLCRDWNAVTNASWATSSASAASFRIWNAVAYTRFWYRRIIAAKATVSPSFAFLTRSISSSFRIVPPFPAYIDKAAPEMLPTKIVQLVRLGGSDLSGYAKRRIGCNFLPSYIRIF